MTEEMIPLSQRTLLLLLVYAAAVGALIGAIYELFRLRRLCTHSDRQLYLLLGRYDRITDTEAEIPPRTDDDGITVVTPEKSRENRQKRHIVPARLRRILPGAPKAPSPRVIGQWTQAALIFAEDIAFAVISAAVVILLLYNVSDGQFRAPAMFGCVLGFVLWRFTVGRITQFIAAYIILSARKAGRFVLRIMRALYRRIAKAAAAVFGAFRRAGFAIWRRVFAPTVGAARRRMVISAVIRASEKEKRRFIESAEIKQH